MRSSEEKLLGPCKVAFDFEGNCILLEAPPIKPWVWLETLGRKHPNPVLPSWICVSGIPCFRGKVLDGTLYLVSSVNQGGGPETGTWQSSLQTRLGEDAEHIYQEWFKTTSREIARAQAEAREHLYGTCPHCGARGISRERRPNGNDRCAQGHIYPSSAAVISTTPETA